MARRNPGIWSHDGRTLGRKSGGRDESSHQSRKNGANWSNEHSPPQ
jgi:hypothetical protein